MEDRMIEGNDEARIIEARMDEMEIGDKMTAMATPSVSRKELGRVWHIGAGTRGDKKFVIRSRLLFGGVLLKLWIRRYA